MSVPVAERRELAPIRGVVRNSKNLREVEPLLKRMAALYTRDDVAPSMAERVVCLDPAHVNLIVSISQLVAESMYEPIPISIKQAVETLGWSVMKEVALIAGLHVVQTNLCRHASLNPVALSEQAYVTSVAATAFDASSMIGLFLNIGVGAMAAIHGESYSHLVGAIKGTRTPLASAEQMAFGHDHAIIGAVWLVEVGFPDALCVAVAEHIGLETPYGVAELMTHLSGLDGGIGLLPAELTAECAERFDLSEREIARFDSDLAGAAEFVKNMLI